MKKKIRILRAALCLLLALLTTLAFTSCGAVERLGTKKDGTAPEGPASYSREGTIGIAGDEYVGEADDVGEFCDGDPVIGKDAEGGEGKTEVPEVKAGLLTAAEWRDNDHWDFWKKLINENKWYDLADKWHLFATDRIVVTLGTPEAPITGAEVTLSDPDGKTVWQAISDRTGKAYLFRSVDGKKSETGNGWQIGVKAGTQTVTVEWNGEGAVALLDDVAGTPKAPRLDLMFTVDTTGSMSDELEYLKAELENVVSRVQNECQLTARVSVNFYRDEDDEYVIRSFPFGTVKDAIGQIGKQCASGGGDYPEAVHKALADSITGHEWNTAPEAVKLMFLVLDAPAHDNESVKESIRDSITEAAAQGIRVIPVMCSGVEADCEELCRSFAVLTGGTYVFLTNDSGIGGDHLEATVGEHTVEPLGDLLVRVICEYCR